MVLFFLLCVASMLCCVLCLCCCFCSVGDLDICLGRGVVSCGLVVVVLLNAFLMCCWLCVLFCVLCCVLLCCVLSFWILFVCSCCVCA